MQASELRIGNIVTHCDYSGPAFTVTEIARADDTHIVFTDGGKNGTWDNNIECVEPVPLTKEWLTEFGFRYDGLCYDADGIMIGEYKDGLFLCKGGLSQRFPNQIKYVHQLQNIYYNLIGKELTITDHAKQT